MTTPPQGASQRGYASRITRRRWLTGDTFLLDLERPPGFRFTAGQRIQLVMEDHARDYSLIPGEGPDTLTLLIRHVPGGALTSRLSRCPEGAGLHFNGPSGHFIYRRTARPAVFVATGTGIAPFAAMCRAGVRGGTLLHGVRHMADLYFREDLEAAVDRYVPCLSGGGPPVPAGAFGGRVTRYLQKRLPRKDCDVYLAGRREMIAEAIGILDDLFPSSRIYTEIFY